MTDAIERSAGPRVAAAAEAAADARSAPVRPARGPLVYRQSVWTRITHWVWAVCLFFLLLTGLQIFNAHPTLYVGEQSGFGFDNAVLRMHAERGPDGTPRGLTTVFGHTFDTTGVLGYSGAGEDAAARGFPAWATIPSFQDLATGRVVHFFFAWVLVGTLLLWLLASVLNGHLRGDILPTPKDIGSLPRDIAEHATLRFRHGRRYNVLQKLSYGGTFFVLFPLMILTGLTMSPGMDSSWTWLLDLFGGRQTARTIHFATMLTLVAFFVVHVVMVVLAGPFNEMRSMITGWYRTSADTHPREGDAP